jgi:hypothetical protein
MEATNAQTLHIVVQGPDESQIIRALSSLDRNIVEFRSTPNFRRAKLTIDVAISPASPLESPIFVAVFIQNVVLRSALARGIDPDEFLFLDTGTKLDDGE